MSDTYNIKPDCFKEEGSLCVVSHFGLRTDPKTGQPNTKHNGLDCVRKTEKGNRSATITAIAGGEVIGAHWGETSNVNYQTARGNWVKIDHGGGIVSLYQHLENTYTAKTGDIVKKGQELGIMGMTGKSTGVHLHFEIQIDGKPVDPLPYLLRETPINEEERTSTVYYNIQIKDKLYQGMTGEKVKALQARVAQISPEYEAEIKGHSMNADNELDGSFGSSMTKTLRKLQKAAGLPETGITDDATRELLNGNILDLNLKIANAKKALE